MSTPQVVWTVPTVDGYPVMFTPTTRDGAPWWMASLPDLPGCVSDGETRVAALEHLEDAATLYIDTAIEDRVRIPHPYSSYARTTGTGGTAE